MPRSLEALADRVGGQREQGGCQRVDKGDLISRIQSQHALGDTGENGLPLLGQRHHVGGLHAQRLPLDPAGQKQGTGDAQEHRRPKVGQQGGSRRGQGGPATEVRLSSNRYAQLTGRLVVLIRIGQDRHGGRQDLCVADGHRPRPGSLGLGQHLWPGQGRAAPTVDRCSPR